MTPPEHRSAVSLHLLGDLDLRTATGDEVRSVLAQPKRLALLVYLALEKPGGFVARDTLLAIFWPEKDTQRARWALNQTIRYLRKSLGAGTIVSRGQEVGIAPGRIHCDAAAFEAALNAGRTQEALNYYKGELLPGFFVDDARGFESWLENKRAQLRRRASEAGWDLAKQFDSEGHARDAATWARWAAGTTPFDEAAHRDLISLLTKQGNRAAAIQVFEDFARRLHAEMEMEPSAQTRALVDRVRSDDAPKIDGPDAAIRPSRQPSEAAPATPHPPYRDFSVDAPNQAAARETATSPPQPVERMSGVREIPSWMSHSQGAITGIVVSLALLLSVAVYSFTGGAGSVSLDAAEPATNTVVVGMETLRRGHHEEVVSVGGLKMAERFRGEVLSEDGEYDVLAPSVGGPLALAPGAPGRNLYRGDHSIHGPNISGAGPGGIRGGGAMAVLFDTDQSEFGVTIIRSEGGPATFYLYRRDGSLADSIVIESTRNQTYTFRRPRGIRDIAGFSVQNRDPRHGLSFKDFRFEPPANIDRVETDHVAVFPFTVRGDSVAARSVAIGARIAATLDNAGELRTVRPTRFRTGGDVTGGDLSRDLRIAAAQQGAGRFVAGDVTALDGRLYVNAALYGPVDGTPPMTRARAEGSPGEISQIVDELTRELLSVGPGPSPRYLASLAAATAGSVPALKAYLSGEEALRQGRFPDAIERFEGVVAQDPDFALAHYRLSQALQWSGDNARARETAIRAGTVSADLPDEDQRRLLAWRSYISGEARTAEQTYRTLADATPDDADASFVLGVLLFDREATGAAQATFERVIFQEPDHVGAMAHLARLAAMSGSTAQVQHFAGRVLSSDPAPALAHEMRALRELHVEP